VLGSPFSKNIAPTVQSAAKRTVSSNITGTKAGQEFIGFPPTLIGQSTAEVQYCNPNAHMNPVNPAAKVTYGSGDRFRP
jgi:hypothetical protein